METIEYQRGEYVISTDPNRLNIESIHAFLQKYTYWAQTRPIDVVRCSVQNSLNFGVYNSGEMVGYARVVTDYATFSWLCDVIIVPEQRGQGLGKWLVDCVVNHPALKNQRRLLLATRDAHELYRVYGGFEPLEYPSRWMEKINRD
jgi:GNAT superfamily N-acetyltransferase